MQKSRFACLTALSILAFVFIAQAALSQDSSGCTPKFLISSPESVDMSSTFVWVDITVTNTGSCEGSTTIYPLIPEGWYIGDNFSTKTLQAGESENSSIKIMTSNAKSAIIQFAADGAKTSQTKIIRGGLMPDENVTQPPIITPAANASEAAQNQEAVPTTGLVTANPSAQIAVFAILLFGAGYLAARIKTEGFRYKFKK